MTKLPCCCAALSACRSCTASPYWSKIKWLVVVVEGVVVVVDAAETKISGKMSATVNHVQHVTRNKVIFGMSATIGQGVVAVELSSLPYFLEDLRLSHHPWSRYGMQYYRDRKVPVCVRPDVRPPTGDHSPHACMSRFSVHSSRLLSTTKNQHLALLLLCLLNKEDVVCAVARKKCLSRPCVKGLVRRVASVIATVKKVIKSKCLCCRCRSNHRVHHHWWWRRLQRYYYFVDSVGHVRP